MGFLKSNFLKRIVVMITIIMIVLASISSPVHASKVKMGENDFYYAGTSKGQYKVSMSILAWLLELIKQIAGFLFALITMIPRMAIVGWTAIFELLLTTGLNAFTGVPMDNANLNATDVDANGSADHVTIQAIVFNQVPVLNCNLFDFDDKEKLNTCIDGTGHYWIHCETCAAQDPLIASNPSREHLCRMKGQCKCTECAAYREAFGVKENDENPYLIIKKNIAMWYYVMRLMAAAAMLVVLVYVGIKIAITTVASEKAVFKRMLVDWVVGAILLFSTQYIMAFIIQVNESMITVMADIEANMKDNTRKEFHKEEVEIINDELEQDLYQEVRTRAYDMKGVNSVSGMLMYIALVVMAYKYTIIYLKRLFTIIILTLMAPGVAFSYAIQKVSTGKSSAFSKWLQEYMVQVLIQTVHAIIYVTFISYALMISLDSIPGTIYALVVMHYMPKFDETFRKIFKFGGSGLHEEDIKSSSAKAIAGSLKSAGAMVGAAALVGKLPTSKLVTAPVKALAGVQATAKSKVMTKLADKYMDHVEEGEAERMAATLGAIDGALQLDGAESKEYAGYLEEGEMELGSGDDTYKAKEAREYGIRDADIIGKELDTRMQSALAALDANPDDKEAAAKLAQVMKLKQEFDKVGRLGGNKFSGFVRRRLYAQASRYKQKYHPDKYSKLVIGKDGKMKRKYNWNPFKVKYDPNTNKLVGAGSWAARRDSSAFLKTMSKNGGLGALRKMIFTPTKFAQEFVENTNYSPEMKKLLSEQVRITTNIAVGALATGAGLANLVDNPLAGMGLLLYGRNTRQEFKRAYGLRDPNRFAPRVDKVAKRYSFNRFSAASSAKISRKARQLAKSAAIDAEKHGIPGVSEEALKLRVNTGTILGAQKVNLLDVMRAPRGSRGEKWQQRKLYKRANKVANSVSSFSRNRMGYKRLHPGARAVANFATGGLFDAAAAVRSSGGELFRGMEGKNVSTQSLLYKIQEQATKELNETKDKLIEDSLRAEMEYLRLDTEAEIKKESEQYADKQERMQQELDELLTRSAVVVAVTDSIEQKAEEKKPEPEDDGNPEEDTDKPEEKKETEEEPEVRNVETVILSGEIDRSAQAIVDKAVGKIVIRLAADGRLESDLRAGDIAAVIDEIDKIMEQNGLGKNSALIKDLQLRIKQASRKMIDDAKAMKEGRELPETSDHKLEKIIVDMAVKDTVTKEAKDISADLANQKSNGVADAKPKKSLKDFLSTPEFESAVRESAQKTIDDIAFGGNTSEIVKQLTKTREGVERGEQQEKLKILSIKGPEESRTRPVISETVVQNGVTQMREVNRPDAMDIVIRDIGKGIGQSPKPTKESGKPSEASTSKTQRDARRRISVQEATDVIADDLLQIVALSPDEQRARDAQKRAEKEEQNVDSVLGDLLKKSALGDEGRELDVLEINNKKIQANVRRMQYLNQEAATSNIKKKGDSKDYRAAKADLDNLESMLSSLPADKVEERQNVQRQIDNKKQDIRNNGPLLDIVDMINKAKGSGKSEQSRTPNNGENTDKSGVQDTLDALNGRKDGTNPSDSENK